MKASVVTFPGSNCDKDIGSVLEEFYNIKVNYIWHKDSIPSGQDLVVLPGGFSYGDYLRCGAMARFSPAMESVVDYASKGGKVLGICNGFQVLTEAGLLPGALTNNLSLKYICKDVEMETSIDSKNYWKSMTAKNHSNSFTWPIAHGEGRYYADKQTLDSLENDGLVLAYYKENPNGSERHIAGISSPNKKVVGMMPHPERAMNPYTGLMDGKLFFDYFLGI
ncbi:phosphoribosylformylglycinamidine synthase subunit PurQ [Leptospira sp. GIMC2001]|uniref:phosphoribosylformylglycinamidine synthase subunit PurQ n=1 Tax=Leptospira sp. GIMC2001 TaxID=1513297 RepID=UPI0023490F49|nr:phosphoribosylformylglycinamidine synthase subunit PurQ [Leptospira sp. GIMC2001]WCL51127.1 phosphoribosylformylglycinamidine synthase subunit PurQ [Leptospira sp. GIMC2001]